MKAISNKLTFLSLPSCSIPGKRRVGPVQMGKGVGLVPISRRPGCARGAAFRCQYLFHPSWDKQVPSMKLVESDWMRAV